MAIAYVGTTRIVQTSSTGTSDTQSFTTSGGTNRGLVVSTLESAHTITAMTYNGATCTQVDFKDDAVGQRMSLWRCEAPTTGANNLVSTVASGTFIEYVISEYTGVDQTNMDDGHSNTLIASGSPLTHTATVGTANSWLCSNGRNQSIAVMTASTGVVSTRGTGLTQHNYGDSNGTVSTGSQTQSWTTSGTGVKSFGAIMAIKAAAAATPTTYGNLMMMGV